MSNSPAEHSETPNREHIARLAETLGLQMDSGRVEALGEQIDAHMSMMQSVTTLNTNNLEPAAEFHLDEEESLTYD